MARDRSWLEREADKVLEKLERFESQGDLTRLSEGELLELAKLCKQNLADAFELWEEHQRHYPSSVWFGISVVSGYGGLFLVEPVTASVIITIGGALGATKSIYDRGAHLIREQRYLDLYWRASRHRDAVAVELTRRGIRF